MIFAIFPHPGRLRLLLGPIWLYQRLGLQWLLRRSGLLNLLPPTLRGVEALLPSVSLRALRARMPSHMVAQGGARRRVGLLQGCGQRGMFPGVNGATARGL